MDVDFYVNSRRTGLIEARHQRASRQIQQRWRENRGSWITGTRANRVAAFQQTFGINEVRQAPSAGPPVSEADTLVPSPLGPVVDAGERPALNPNGTDFEIDDFTRLQDNERGGRYVNPGPFSSRRVPARYQFANGEL